jgi:Zn-dependent peptidase ImmA (M78 family)
MENDLDQIGSLSKEREEDLAAFASFLAHSYFPNSSRVDPEQIALRKGITFSYGRYGNGFDGLLQYKKGRFHIFSNLDQLEDPYYPRARFTFSHELAHFFIDEHRNALMRGIDLYHPSRAEYQSKLLVEREADFFAGHLLVPEERLSSAYRIYKSNIGLELVIKLQSIFHASATNLAIRCAKDNLFSCGVMKWSVENELQWYWLSDAFLAGAPGKAVSKIRQVGPSAASYKAANEVYNNEEKIHRSKLPLSAYFPFLKTKGHTDFMVQEQAIKLGRFGTLAMLLPAK